MKRTAQLQSARALDRKQSIATAGLKIRSRLRGLRYGSPRCPARDDRRATNGFACAKRQSDVESKRGARRVSLITLMKSILTLITAALCASPALAQPPSAAAPPAAAVSAAAADANKPETAAVPPKIRSAIFQEPGQPRLRPLAGWPDAFLSSALGIADEHFYSSDGRRRSEAPDE